MSGDRPVTLLELKAVLQILWSHTDFESAAEEAVADARRYVVNLIDREES